MLNIYKEKILFLILFSIIFNYFLFFIGSGIFIKINFSLFIFFSIFYLIKYENNKVLIIFISIIILIALGTPSDSWDARSIWLFKAKQIFYDNSVLSVKHNYAQFSHPDYPNLAPAFVAGMVKTLGYWNEVYPKTGFSLLFLPPLIIISNFFSKNFFLITIVFVLFAIGRFLFNGEMDGLVSVYFVTSALLIYNYNKKIRLSIIEVLTLISILVIFTMLKLESLFLILSFVFSIILINISEKKINKKILLYLFISLIPIILWHIFCIYFKIHNIYSDPTSQILQGELTGFAYNISDFSKRFTSISNYILIGKYLLINEKLIIALTFFFISSFIRNNKKIVKIVIFTISIYLIILFTTYMSTPIVLEMQLSASAYRVIKPVILFLFIFGLYNLTKKSKFV